MVYGIYIYMRYIYIYIHIYTIHIYSWGLKINKEIWWPPPCINSSTISIFLTKASTRKNFIEISKHCSEPQFRRAVMTYERVPAAPYFFTSSMVMLLEKKRITWLSRSWIYRNPKVDRISNVQSYCH